MTSGDRIDGLNLVGNYQVSTAEQALRRRKADSAALAFIVNVKSFYDQSNESSTVPSEDDEHSSISFFVGDIKMYHDVVNALEQDVNDENLDTTSQLSSRVLLEILRSQDQ